MEKRKDVRETESLKLGVLEREEEEGRVICKCCEEERRGNRKDRRERGRTQAG